ncbi:MAG: endolysin [Wendovervirus sonii]|uniref:Endolysin n=1 Tax=phage Lak_Megaphage_Sonny TaxID=3109229 RepID=A0ABZ0Z3K6_9CAUD|nr:MAG: endolysin [phage Lak_Megaphage_Sonny]
MDNKILYEQLIHNINYAIYNELNEAYNNELFEEFNFKDFFDDTVQKAKDTMNTVKDKTVEMKIDAAYKFVKRYIAGIIDKIKEQEGKEKAQQYINSLKVKLDELAKNAKAIQPRQIVNVAKVLAGTVLSAVILTQIYNNANDKAETKYQDEFFKSHNIESTFVQNPFDIEYEQRMLLPADYFKDHDEYKMNPSKECVKFIYDHEVLCLYPYYATPNEKSGGKITIGVGHVIFDGTNWILPQCLSSERRMKLKNDIIKYKKLIQRSKCENGVNTAKSANMPNLLTKEEALKIFKEDIEKADTRVRQTLGLKSCGNEKYNVFGKINKNIGLYCYYNQNIYDALLSYTFNAGVLPNSLTFSKRLQNCRYDDVMNKINDEDFAYTFAAFKNGNNPDRREKEYTLCNLGNISKILQNFHDEIKR